MICGALAGAGLGFLWFNAYPAEVFMGDVGALALGAALGTIAVIVRQEIVLFIMGGVFVAETLSVMIQVLYFKWTAASASSAWRRCTITTSSKGWKESQVVVRFWIITMMLVLFGLSTLKLQMMREPAFHLLPRPQRIALAGKRVLVLGLGDTGLSVARWPSARRARARRRHARAPPPRQTMPAMCASGRSRAALLDGRRSRVHQPRPCRSPSR